MSHRPKKNKEFYAVLRGHFLETPTIFSSWGDVHPLINGYGRSLYKGFFSLEDAEKYMASAGIDNYKFVIKDGAGDTTPLRDQIAFYAVAGGRSDGIHRYYEGGAKPEVTKFPGACHKHFRTLQQATDFIADWEAASKAVKSRIKKEYLGINQPVKEPESPIKVPVTDDDATITDELGSELSKLTLSI